MKKLTLTMVCSLAVAGAAFAQGTVNWSGISFSAFTAQTNSTTYSPLFGGGSPGGGTIGNVSSSTIAPGAYLYELVYLGGSQVSAPSTWAALSSWSDAGIGAVQAATAGRVNSTPATTAATVPWAAGVTDNIALVVWSANLGANWNAVKGVLNGQTWGAGSFFGVSNLGYETPGAADPGSVFVGGGASATGSPIQSTLTQAYLLPPIPEPTTLALCGLGGLSLLLFRRQRK